MGQKGFGQEWFLKGNGQQQSTLSWSNLKGHDMLFRSTGSLCIAMSGASAGVGATSATSSAMQLLSEGDPWKFEEPTVEVRCHRHSAQNANLTTYNAK